MEVDERPTEQYSDVGGLDKQIQEVGYLNNSTTPLNIRVQGYNSDLETQ